MNDSFYRDYEDRHRGSRELIKTRLRAYVPFLQPLTSRYHPATAIDLGCGRGEWLELLDENGIEAQGVDLDEGMLAACHERGLNARHADALQALQATPDDSIAVVSAFHVVEHMPFVVVRSLIREALRVLQPGGLLILETPNPENLVVGASSFYQDPSHERPLPSELLSFAVEHAGFYRTKVVRLQEAPELHTTSAIRLLNVLNGVSPDYSVVAQKSASGEVLAEFDAPFQVDYGISLETLASRYDTYSERRIADINHLLAQSEARIADNAQHMATRISHVEDRLVQTESRTAQAEARIIQMEARAAKAEVQAGEAAARAAQSTADLHAVLLSRSWRITAPLRYVGAVFYRIRTAVREGRLLSGSKRRATSLLRRLGHSVLRQPRLMQMALSVLNRFPGIKHRLRNVMRAPASAPRAQQQPGHMSPRTARTYAELKKAMDSRKN